MDNAQSEPSMEEILASIRRIISEDEDDARPAQPAAQAGAKAEPAAKPVETRRAEPAPAPKPSAAAQTPERSAPVDTPAQPKAAPTPIPLEAENVEMIRKNVAEAMEQEMGEPILDEPTATAASEAFHNLSETVRVSSREGGQTLEDIVTVMLQPMIKEWLNQNLPAIVEEKVEEEVQRVARRRRG